MSITIKGLSAEDNRRIAIIAEATKELFNITGDVSPVLLYGNNEACPAGDMSPEDKQELSKKVQFLLNIGKGPVVLVTEAYICEYTKDTMPTDPNYAPSKDPNRVEHVVLQVFMNGGRRVLITSKVERVVGGRRCGEWELVGDTADGHTYTPKTFPQGKGKEEDEEHTEGEHLPHKRY